MCVCVCVGRVLWGRAFVLVFMGLEDTFACNGQEHRACSSDDYSLIFVHLSPWVFYDYFFLIARLNCLSIT